MAPGLWSALERAFAREIAALRPADPAATRADAEARLARVDALLTASSAQARAINGDVYACGLLPDRRKAPRPETAP